MPYTHTHTHTHTPMTIHNNDDADVIDVIDGYDDSSVLPMAVILLGE